MVGRALAAEHAISSAGQGWPVEFLFSPVALKYRTMCALAFYFGRGERGGGGGGDAWCNG